MSDMGCDAWDRGEGREAAKKKADEGSNCPVREKLTIAGIPTKGTMLPQVELLQAQNLHQKILIEGLRYQIALQAAQQHEERKKALLEELARMKEEIAKEHGIDLDTHVIMEETGQVVRKDQIPDLAKMMGLVSGLGAKEK